MRDGLRSSRLSSARHHRYRRPREDAGAGMGDGRNANPFHPWAWSTQRHFRWFRQYQHRLFWPEAALATPAQQGASAMDKIQHAGLQRMGPHRRQFEAQSWSVPDGARSRSLAGEVLQVMNQFISE